MPNSRPPSESRQQDLDLLRAAARGDVEARELFGRRLSCVPAMLRTINRRHGSPLRGDEIEDVVQETAAAVWRKIDSYRGVGSLESWLYQFSSYELLRFLDRRRRRQSKVELRETLDDRWVESADSPALRDDHVHLRLRSLSSVEQDVVRARFFEHLTLEQTAERLGIPVNTAKTRYYRGIEKLATLMREQGEDG